MFAALRSSSPSGKIGGLPPLTNSRGESPTRAEHPKAWRWLVLPALLGSAVACKGAAAPGPEIDGVEPSRVPYGSAQEGVIRGRHFLSQVDVDLDSRGAPRVGYEFQAWIGSPPQPAAAVTYIDSQTLTLRIPATLPVGTHAITVRTPVDRRVTLQDALTVFAPDAPAAARGGAAGEPTTWSGSGATVGGLDDTSVGYGGGGVAGGGRAGQGGAPGTSGGGGGPHPGGASAGSAGQAGFLAASGGAGIDGMDGGTTSEGAMGGQAAGAADELGGAGGASGAGARSVTGWPDASAGHSGFLGLGGEGGSVPSAGAAGLPLHDTLWTEGETLYDTCGNPIVLQGVEQIMGNALPPDEDWVGLAEGIIASGSNAVRLHAEELTLGELDPVLARLSEAGLVIILVPENNEWLGDVAVKALLDRYQRQLVLDVFGWVRDDRPLFFEQASQAVLEVRAQGYRVPLEVISNLGGRDLPAALTYGPQIAAADPLKNIIVVWHAFWGDSGWYQDLYGMSVAEGFGACTTAEVPIVAGLTLVTDWEPTEYLDYLLALEEARLRGVGWIWWDWFNPYGSVSNLSVDGSSEALTALGEEVAPYLQNAVLPCRSAPAP